MLRVISFDYLVGTQQQCDRNIMADRMCSLEIDDELEIGRLLDRNVGRLDAPQRFDDHPRRLAEDTRQASAISYQATFFRHFGPLVYGREPQLGGAFENEAAVGDQQPRCRTLIAAAPDILISFIACSMSSGVRTVKMASSMPRARSAS